MSEDEYPVLARHRCEAMREAMPSDEPEGGEYERIYLGRFGTAGTRWWLYDESGYTEVGWPIVYCPFCGVKLPLPPKEDK